VGNVTIYSIDRLVPELEVKKTWFKGFRSWIGFCLWIDIDGMSSLRKTTPGANNEEYCNLYLLHYNEFKK